MFKSGSQESINNYGPRSILPVLSKIIEKVAAAQLIKHRRPCSYSVLTSLGLDPVPQPTVNTVTNCLVSENAKRSLDKGSAMGAVFINPKKAHNTSEM